MYSHIIGQEPCPDEMVSAYNNRALAYNALGMSEEAISDYNAGLVIEPSLRVLMGLHINRGHAYLQSKKYRDAIDDFTRVLDLDLLPEENKLPILSNRGFAYLKAGNFWDAIDDLSVVVDDDENYMGGFIHLGDAYMGMGITDTAIECYRSAVRIFEDIPPEERTTEDLVEHKRVRERLSKFETHTS